MNHRASHCIRSAAVALTTWSVIIAGAGAQQPAGDAAAGRGAGQALPGGATQLQETHGDWRVICAPQNAQNGQILCTLTQQQADKDSRQLILGIELKTSAADKAEGTLILPFGLAVGKPVRVQVDDSATPQTLQIRTCLPIGCVASLAFDSPAVAALKKGAVLNINATADGGQDAAFKISLKGFASAFDRTAALSK